MKIKQLTCQTIEDRINGNPLLEKAYERYCNSGWHNVPFSKMTIENNSIIISSTRNLTISPKG